MEDGHVVECRDGGLRVVPAGLVDGDNDARATRTTVVKYDTFYQGDGLLV
jgi:hypothetical protein